MSPYAFISAEACKYLVCCRCAIKTPNFSVLALANAWNTRFQDSSSSLLIRYSIHWLLSSNFRIFVFSLMRAAKGPYLHKVAHRLYLFPLMPLFLLYLLNPKDVSSPASSISTPPEAVLMIPYYTENAHRNPKDESTENKAGWGIQEIWDQV